MLTISIVVYKPEIKKLSTLINSIIDCSIIDRLFLVDNSPSILNLKISSIEKIDYILNNKNVGFGAGHNIAIKKSMTLNAKYHFVVNPDIYFESGTIEKIVDYMNQNLKVGLLMPQIRYPNGLIQYLPKLIPSPIDLLIRRLSLLRKIFSKRLERYELKQESESSTFNTPIISGCFSCFRIEALQKVGLYDESFFMYFEDFDISRRINKQYLTTYYSDVHVFHEYERGAQKSFALLKIFILSAMKYFNKWGWVFDNDRRNVNKATIQNLKAN